MVAISGQAVEGTWIPQNFPEHLTGTSIMAVEFDGGVVIGADSRSTTGAYVANRMADKLTKVTEFIYCCRSGSSSDTQAIVASAAYHLKFQEIVLNEPTLVKAAAQVIQDLCYTNRESLTASIIVAGWDALLGGQVYAIPLGGMCTRQSVAVGGSGSSYIYGYVDALYQPEMDAEQCRNFVHQTLSLAMARDGSSGGIVNIATISEEGVQRQTLLARDNANI